MSEFLKEHWRRLLLCLGVLLMVVSSTVGAEHVLGPGVWSPAGKCILALAYTVLFAALAAGLRRWEAEHASRMVAGTTLLLVALNLALVGQLGLFHHWPAGVMGWLQRLALLAVEAATLGALSYRLLALLGLRSASWLLQAFLALSTVNVFLASGSSRSHGLAALIALGTLFLAGAWLCARRWRLADGATGVAYPALALLTGALLLGIMRVAALVPSLHPSLYAVPAILVGIALLHAGARLGAGQSSDWRPALLAYGGQVLAATAFALALARPPGVSVLFSGNTLATALLGLALCSALLARTRHPAYLYAGVAALALAYFGAGYFIGDLVYTLEDAARRALGYEDALPKPFKALNGILFNLLLGFLAIRCRRSWNDPRLTKHCHAIGLTVAVAACALSCFEAKAAVLCLAAYTLLFVLGAVLFREPRLIYLSVAASAAGGHFALVVAGATGVATHAVLGVALAILCRLLSAGCRRAAEPFRALGVPLGNSSLVLTLLAAPASWTSSTSLVLLAIDLLLQLARFPSPAWLYAILGALARAFQLALLPPAPDAEWVKALVVAAFALWALAVAARRWKPVLCARLDGSDRGYEFPFFNAAALAGAGALFLRLAGTLTKGDAWHEHAVLTLLLAVLSALMLRAYPRRGWLHIAAALFTLGLAQVSAPWLTEVELWLCVGLLLAWLWRLVEGALERVDARIAERAGDRSPGYAAVARGWSWTLAGTAALLCAAWTTLIWAVWVVFPHVAEAAAQSVGASAWLFGALSYPLIAGYLWSRRADLPAAFRRAASLVVLILAVWWLGVASSPLRAALAIPATSYFSCATVLVALAVALLSAWERRRSAGEADTRHAADALRGGPPAVERWYCGILVLLIVSCVRPWHGGLSAFVLSTATATFLTLAFSQRHIFMGWIGGATFVAAAIRLALLPVTAGVGAAVATGAAVAALILTIAAGTRRTHAAGHLAADSDRFRHGLADGWETLAVGATCIAVVALAQSLVGTGVSEAIAPRVSLFALLCVALCHLTIAARRKLELLVYTAEAALVGAYLLARDAFGDLHGLDALVLLVFAFADLTISEALERRHLSLFARPTFYVSLVLPLVSFALAVGNAAWDEVGLTFLFSAASFYGVVCHQKRWKEPGYLAALLYTGFLWLAWSRLGWRFTEYPQLYLIPVGILAVLFAEVNRAQLGRQTVQILRSLGATLAYVSTAIPMWQVHSFVPWAMLLLLSLTGILVGIGMRVQSFLGLGLICFLFALFYPLGRLGMEHAVVRWGIMLGLGLLLVLFAALTEKRQFLATLRGYYEEVRRWD